MSKLQLLIPRYRIRYVCGVGFFPDKFSGQETLFNAAAARIALEWWAIKEKKSCGHCEYGTECDKQTDPECLLELQWQLWRELALGNLQESNYTITERGKEQAK